MNPDEIKEILASAHLQGSLKALHLQISMMEGFQDHDLYVLSTRMSPIPFGIAFRPGDSFVVNGSSTLTREDLKDPASLRAAAAYGMFVSVFHEFLESLTFGDQRMTNPHDRKDATKMLHDEILAAAKAAFRRHKDAFR